MFESGGLLMISGIFLGIFMIAGAVWFVNRLFVHSTQEILVRFILLIFTALVALFIVDKLVAWKVELLPPDQNRELFDLIKTLVLMIFSYYFGTRVDKKGNSEDSSK
jgi:hypothetical protein